MRYIILTSMIHFTLLMLWYGISCCPVSVCLSQASVLLKWLGHWACFLAWRRSLVYPTLRCEDTSVWIFSQMLDMSHLSRTDKLRCALGVVNWTIISWTKLTILAAVDGQLMTLIVHFQLQHSVHEVARIHLQQLILVPACILSSLDDLSVITLRDRDCQQPYYCTVFFNCVRCIKLNFAHCCVRAVCHLQVLQHQPQMTDVQYICLSPWSSQIVCCLQWLYFGRTYLHYALSLYFCVHWCCSPECVSFYTACRLLEQFSTTCVVIFLHNVNFFSYILQLVRPALLALTDITVDQ